MEEEQTPHIEVIGSGFVVLPDGRGIPGVFGNVHITHEGVVVSPDTAPAEQPTQTEQPAQPSEPIVQPTPAFTASFSTGG